MKLYADTQILSKRIDRQIERCDRAIEKTQEYRRDQKLQKLAERLANPTTPEFQQLIKKWENHE